MDAECDEAADEWIDRDLERVTDEMAVVVCRTDLERLFLTSVPE